MALYSCAKCGMSVLTTCGKCNVPLVDDHVVTPDGRKVEVAKCPKCQGKIKSPLCCGQDMSCPTPS